MRTAYRLARQIFHPIEAVDLNYRDEALEYLIALKAGENDPRRHTYCRCDYRRGKNDEEYEDKVVFKYEGYVTAALDESEQTRRLIAGADKRY